MRSRRSSTGSTSSWSSPSTARAARAWSSARRPTRPSSTGCAAGCAGPARLDRAARRPALDRAHARRRGPAAPARRPAPVRGQRRRRDLGAARRAHPRGAAEGELVVNSSQGGGSKDTWVLGAGAGSRRPKRPSTPQAAARSSVAPSTEPGGRAGAGPAAAAAAEPAPDQGRPAPPRRGARRAEPHRRVALLDRPLRRARRRHRTPPRRAPAVLLEDPWADEDLAAGRCWPSWTRHAGRRRHGRPTCGPRPARLRPDAEPSAIAGALLAARENARRAREVSPPSCGSASTPPGTGLPSPSHSASDRTPSSPGCASAPRWSPASSTRRCRRDDAWQFLVLGRSLERADMTARLIATGALDGRSAVDGGVLSALRRPAGLPAQRPRHARRTSAPRRSCARPALPALGALRPHRGRAVPARALARGRAARRLRRGTTPARQHRGRPWNTASRPTSSAACRRRCRPCGQRSRPRRPRSRSATSCPAHCRRGPRSSSDMRRFRIVHSTSMTYDHPRAGVAQRAAHEPGQRGRPDDPRQPRAGQPLTWSRLYRDHWGTAGDGASSRCRSTRTSTSRRRAPSSAMPVDAPPESPAGRPCRIPPCSTAPRVAHAVAPHPAR